MALKTTCPINFHFALFLGVAVSSGLGCQRTSSSTDGNWPVFPDLGMPDLPQPVDTSEPTIDGALWLPCQPTGTCSEDNWCRCSPHPQGNTLNAVWGSGASDVWTVGNSGTIVHWDGTVWSKSESGITNGAGLNGVWGSSASDVWAVGENGIILHWNGTAWNALLGASGTADPLVDVWGSSASDVWFVGPSYPTYWTGILLHWDGTSWATTPYPGGNAIWGSRPSDMWKAFETRGPNGASGGGCSHWDGMVWSGSSCQAPAGLFGLWGRSASDVWAVGGGGIILHWNGSAWSASASGTTMWLSGVWGSGASDVWAVGQGGTILHWNGKAWNASNSGTTNNLHGVWGSSASDIWVVGDNTILHYSP